MGADLIQRARDIVANVYIEQQAKRGRSETFSSNEAWERHKNAYVSYMREGAYDDDISIQATLIALERVSA